METKKRIKEKLQQTYDSVVDERTKMNEAEEYEWNGERFDGIFELGEDLAHWMRTRFNSVADADPIRTEWHGDNLLVLFETLDESENPVVRVNIDMEYQPDIEAITVDIMGIDQVGSISTDRIRDLPQHRNVLGEFQDKQGTALR